MSDEITLDMNSKSVQYLCKKDNCLAKVISMVGSITYKTYEDCYQFLVETIVGQMLSNKVADLISKRLEILYNGSVNADIISQLSGGQIKGIGISNSKVTYIRNLYNFSF